MPELHFHILSHYATSYVVVIFITCIFLFALGIKNLHSKLQLLKDLQLQLHGKVILQRLKINACHVFSIVFSFVLLNHMKCINKM